ncbi:MAG: cell division protein ZipA C-terminal FtsZ-binding domain-containing protein [Acidobacteriota bacterium]
MDFYASRLLLPEEIAAGRVHTADLVFGYSVPRSPAPLAVHDAMLKAARHARSRLGGTLLSAQGRPFDAQEIRQQIIRLVQRLETAGIKPGTTPALLLF